MKYYRPLSKPCRHHRLGTRDNKLCYYCHQSRLIDKLSPIKPEERLLHAIFGNGSRYLPPTKRPRTNRYLGKRSLPPIGLVMG